MRVFKKGCGLGGLAGIACAVALAGFSTVAGAADYKLSMPGKLTVAFTGDMPGIDYQNGKLVGYDGEILQAIAASLGLPINPARMEWSGVISSVQSGRVDIMGGDVGWTEKRTKILVLTDPILYFKNGIAQPDKTNWDKLADLEGKRVGSITGFSFIPELRKIKGIQLSLYDTSDAAIRDLLAGRIEAVIADPPVMSYAISKNPDWHIHFNAFTDNNPDFPLLTGQGQFIYGLNQENAGLADAINARIDAMWKDCSFRRIGAKYGLVQGVWYAPTGANLRAGVDRRKDWQMPSCK